MPTDMPQLPPALALPEEPFDVEDLDAVLVEAQMGIGAVSALDPGRLVRDPEIDAETYPVMQRAPARWRVTDDQTAEWAARHWATATDEIDEIARLREYWTGTINAWASDKTKVLDDRRRFMEAQLEEYALAERVRSGGKRKTVSLPSATVRTRPSPERIEVLDGKAQEFVGWAGSYLPGLVRTKEEPNVKDFGEYLRIDHLIDYVAYHAELTCGHDVEGQVSAEDPLDDLTVWESLPCDVCPADPIDGAPVREVQSIQTTPILRAVVLATIPNPALDDPDERDDTLPETVDVEVPGVGVRPESTTAKVGR